ncbi:MAG: carbohydrate ABC transporter permease [Candidatus Caldatribacterium sp.]|nr:carbohydrate ABC transporter permease [Candidatus Caldatribacterium sp.]MCX7729773.1 carbohydrate ABC transporter permease [Candidatus Caldatribacterium sp.]MDW8081903.1 carbohydrate ABC transporter permease [Candidatus Calescibacterium sp.]
MRLLLLCFLLFLYLVPFFLVFVNALKDKNQIIANPVRLPSVWYPDNFAEAFRKMRYPSAFWNSLVITVLSTTLIIFSSSMTAYLFSRIQWKFNQFMFFLMIASMLIPFQAIMIPLVKIYGSLGLLNNRWTLIYMYLGFGCSFAVFLYHGAIKSIPRELEEAAMIDGCSRLQVFFKIVFPLLKPTTTTVAILDVLWIWNDFLLPSLILISPKNRTLPLSTYYFYGTYTSDYGLLLASLILSITPVIVFYLFMQKHIIKGILQGSIK